MGGVVVSEEPPVFGRQEPRLLLTLLESPTD